MKGLILAMLIGSTSMAATEIDRDNFSVIETAIATQLPHVAVFYLKDCKACQTLEPTLKKLEKSEKITVFRIDAEKLPEVAAALKIEAVPFTIIARGSKVIAVFQGVVPEQDLKQAIKAAKK